MRIVFLFILVTGLACNNKEMDKDTISPVITLTSLTDGQTFTAGQPIPITGTMTDDKFIAETHIHVTNVATGSLLMDVHIYPNGASGSFNQSITAAAGVNYKIQIIARDRGSNEARVSVEVSGN